MVCRRRFGKILCSVRGQYPSYSQSRQMNIAWGVYHKQTRKKKK